MLLFILTINIIIAVISIILALLQFASNWFKTNYSYSSIAHMNFLVGYFCERSLSLTGSLLLQMLTVIFFGIIFSYGMLYDDINHEIFLLSWLVTIMPIFCFFFFIFSLANLGFLPQLISFGNVNIFWLVSNSPSIAI